MPRIWACRAGQLPCLCLAESLPCQRSASLCLSPQPQYLPKPCPHDCTYRVALLADRCAIMVLTLSSDKGAILCQTCLGGCRLPSSTPSRQDRTAKSPDLSRAELGQNAAVRRNISSADLMTDKQAERVPLPVSKGVP